MYSNRTYRLLILFSVAITIFIVFYYAIVAGGLALLALPMAMPFFIAPGIIYFLQLYRKNDRYALLLLPFIIYEFLYIIFRIVRLVTTHYGVSLDFYSSNASLMGIAAIPVSIVPWFDIWAGPLSIFILLLLVHSVTFSAGYTRILWKQFILPYLLVIAIGLFTIVAIKYYSSSTKPQEWTQLKSADCNYAIKMHPAIKPAFGDSFGNSGNTQNDPYLCTDVFIISVPSKNRTLTGGLDIHIYKNSYSTLQEWLLEGWTHASTLPLSGGVGDPLIQSTDEWHYADKSPWKAYFRKEVEKLIPTGTPLTINGRDAIEFVHTQTVPWSTIPSETIVLFILEPNNRVAELQCRNDDVTISTDVCRQMLHSFSFEK